VFAVVVDYAF